MNSMIMRNLLNFLYLGILYSIQPFYQVSCQSDDTHGNEHVVIFLDLKQSV